MSITGTPGEEVETWIRDRGALLPAAETLPLLLGLAPGEAEGWWQNAVRKALSRVLLRPSTPWSKVAIHWLGDEGAGPILKDILPATKEIESALLDVARDTVLTEKPLGQILLQAEERRWSRLHAWAAMQLTTPMEAFRLQKSFPADPWPGLEILVNQLPGPAVVAEAVARPDAQLAGLVARRTVREPALLRQIDPGQRAWRTLWSAHVAAGGACWLPDVNRERLGQALLDAVLEGDEPKGLIVAAAEGLAEIALRHPERSALWEKLGLEGRAELLPRAGEALFRLCSIGQVSDRPEALLMEFVVNAARKVSPSARAITTLLAWSAPLNEEEVIRWLQRSGGEEWASLAEELGRNVLNRGWKRAAKVLYDRSSWILELRPAAVTCQELLPLFDRLLLHFVSGRGALTPSDQAQIIQKVADLGAELSPNGLDDLWERAGGERKRLSSAGIPAVRWREAAIQAHHGALRGGVLALLKELQYDFPHNSELRRAEEVFTHVPPEHKR
ncbi:MULTISPECIES: hypothetical protein [Sorangium]|uniref:hypothetical protein n=1 Tax=Sorangium TaxID=39643 RepID=UPI00101A1088|nr:MULTISPECIES: hypothetical protein [Sorangium]